MAGIAFTVVARGRTRTEKCSYDTNKTNQPIKTKQQD